MYSLTLRHHYQPLPYMLKRCCLSVLLTVLFVLPCLTGICQTVSLREKMTTISAYNTLHQSEKIFIHTDKWNYNKEDTLRFKAYVFDAAMAATNKSGLMYIEIADANNRVINRNQVALNYGVGWGNIILNTPRYNEGTYTLRAYTNWMRNFDEHYIYTRQFTIEGTLDEDWMINSRFELTEQEGLSNIKTNLAFVKNNGSRMFGEELRMRITAGKRTLYNTKLTTGVDGTLDFDFNLPAKTSANDINIAITKRTKREQDVTFNVPVIINRDNKIDLQFMPEGGNLVAGLYSRVGFKAVNEEGKGVDVSGTIYDAAEKKIADFKSNHKGIGWFEFTPQANIVYSAKVVYHGKQLSFPLPAATASGMVMRVDNTNNKDSIIVTVDASADIKQARSMFYLIGQARNVVCYGALVNAATGSKRFAIQRTALPTGVARFTLLNNFNQPVAERVIYVDHHDEIKLNISGSKTSYNTCDSVQLDISASDKFGDPVRGSFSLAVTDDAQVKPDSVNYRDMQIETMLARDVRGDIENPGWYFSGADSVTKMVALDALLLTQGWVKYNWTDVFAPIQNKLLYEAEPDFSVKGRVTNAFGKPLEKSNVVLLSVKPTFVADTVTNVRGEFKFTNLYHYDTVAYSLQAKNKRGRMFNVGIEVDELNPPVFKKNDRRLIPLYVNIDTSRLKAIRTRQAYKEEEAKITGTQLKEVQIKAKKVVKDSQSLVDPGEADFTMNEEEMKDAGKSTLLNVLEKNVKGFKSVGQKGLQYYNINQVFTVFIVDGKSSLFFTPEGLDYYQYMKGVLEYIGAEDVKGIEVMVSGRNQAPYWSEYVAMRNPLSNYYDFTFIEVTTYSGNGLFMKKTPGNYLYRPPVFASTKEFYSPKYAVKTPVAVPDTRSTIFWAPNVITDKKGKGKVSFYTADKTATYTVNIQGADMAGEIGVGESKLYVKSIP